MVPPYDHVNRARLSVRLVDVLKKARKQRETLWARIGVSAEVFAHYAEAVIEIDVWLGVLEQVAAIKPDTDVGMIQTYAVEQVMRIAQSSHPNNNELRAWAKIVDLTRPGTMLSTK